MSWLMWLAAVLAAAVHVMIFCMESLWWSTPEVRKRFRQSPERSEATRLFAFNQGFYNLFLAIGTVTGLILFSRGYQVAGLTLVYWNCVSMAGAALVLVLSSPGMRRGAFIQGAAPAVVLLVGVVRAVGH